MKTIYKYTITHAPIEMPQGAIVVHCDTQDNAWRLWAIVDTDNPTELRQFDVVGTGWEFKDDMHHVKTFIEGKFAWHAVEIK